jgi:tRNA threonylcarbamoyladenosine biosynthesis protein TsaE
MTPILHPNTLEFVSRSPEQTRRLGARLGKLLRGGDILCLQGSLGAGKTCLAQGVGRGWGISQTLISPTYVLIREYERAEDLLRLYHIDLYRVSGVNEAFGLGLDEILGHHQAVCVIEWAERIRSMMPEEHMWIKMDAVDQTRRSLHFVAHGDRHQRLLNEFRRVTFGA